MMDHPLASHSAGHSARLVGVGAGARVYIYKRNFTFREVICYYCLPTIPLNTIECEVQAIPSALKLQGCEVRPGI